MMNEFWSPQWEVIEPLFRIKTEDEHGVLVESFMLAQSFSLTQANGVTPNNPWPKVFFGHNVPLLIKIFVWLFKK